MSHFRSVSIIFLVIFVNLIAITPVFSQTEIPQTDTTFKEIFKKPLMRLADTTYGDNEANGEMTPGRGFQLVKNKFASLNISMYAMVRYLNQMPGKQTWNDHLGREQKLTGRNDFHWHRSMIWFTGFVGTPKFTYTATVWSILTTQQTLVYGNLKYKFNKQFSLGMGITPNVCLRSIQTFPFFSSTDRTMAEDAIRGGFSMGVFASGEILPKLHYMAVVANNLSTLGVKAANLTRDFAYSGTLSWFPTTGEFGPRGGQGDLEHHNVLATRFGVSYVHSREDRFNNTGTPAPDNTQVRMSDGLLFFETGALADGVTVDNANFDLLSVDLGFKYKGLSVYTELYYRTLSNFESDLPTPIKFINDNGYTLQVHYMVVPKRLAVYGIHSMLLDEFKRNPWEAGGGVNVYPLGSRSWRINAQCMYIYKSAAGGTFGLYTAGQIGPTVTVGVDILL